MVSPLAYAAAHVTATPLAASDAALDLLAGGRMRPGQEDDTDAGLVWTLILGFIALAVAVAALFDIASKPTIQFVHAHHDKTIWLMFVLVVPIVGGLIYLLWARDEINSPDDLSDAGPPDDGRP